MRKNANEETTAEEQEKRGLPYGVKWAIAGIALVVLSAAILKGCNVELFEEEETLEFSSVSSSYMAYDTYYVKDGTKFAPVYAINQSFSSTKAPKKLDKSRVMWFTDDEFMVPTHYLGEIVGYKSTSANLSSITLERYEDLGYTIGIYGGSVYADGYYHLSSKNGVVPGSSAEEIFGMAPSEEIRIVSVNGTPVSDWVDSSSGAFRGMEEGEKYAVEFYSGTLRYNVYFVADVHMLQSYELFVYGQEYISDTTHGYLMFDTPENLKSGYYMINGAGLFKYLSFTKENAEEAVDLNEKYYTSQGEMVKEYSQQYSLSVPEAVRDLTITVNYGDIKDETDTGVSPECYVEAPDGTGYEMEVDSADQTMTLSLAVAQAGTWTLNIVPKSLEVVNMSTDSLAVYEETTLLEQTFSIEEGDNTYKMFYVPLEGDVSSQVYGSIIGPDGTTYNLKVNTWKDDLKITHRALFYKFPYMKPGDYKVRVYYYASMNEAGEISVYDYGEESEEITLTETGSE